ncbi:hypothetical protein BH09GEM1_BH09GEM1_13970 [soil metagenome]
MTNGQRITTEGTEDTEDRFFRLHWSALWPASVFPVTSVVRLI